MKHSPLVSIIIPCYNQSKFLNDCISSIKNQSLKDWEAIIVDDGSPNQDVILIGQLLSQNDDRVRFVRKENGGLSSARNFGINIAKGDFIQLLDADDMIEEMKLETHLLYLLKNPEIDIVYGNAKYFDECNPRLYRRPYKSNVENTDWITNRWNESGTIQQKLIMKNMFPVCTPLIRRKIFQNIGLFNHELSNYEDWEFWVRCSVNNVKLHYLNSFNTDALIRVHKNSMTNNNSAMRYGSLIARLNMHGYLKDSYLRKINIKILFQNKNYIRINKIGVLRNAISNSINIRECVYIINQFLIGELKILMKIN
jgi:glycosyltransferase involved in cell wall biosynthesis